MQGLHCDICQRFTVYASAIGWKHIDDAGYSSHKMSDPIVEHICRDCWGTMLEAVRGS